MAQGLGNSWGVETQDSPNRKVPRPDPVEDFEEYSLEEGVTSGRHSAKNLERFMRSRGIQPGARW